MKTFSFFNREKTIKELQSEEFDLLIVGGGITGAGIALDAASRGMKVALVEKNDFASGTSSKSTKLIHGGLRYLKQLDFWLVKEVGTERALVHKLAPHLVIPEKMILPLIDGGTYGSWLTSIGLKVVEIIYFATPVKSINVTVLANDVPFIIKIISFPYAGNDCLIAIGI